MVGLWLSCALVALAPEHDQLAEPSQADRAEPDAERVAFAPRDRRPPSPDLKDPFPPAPPTTRERVPFRARAALDLKNPFDPPRDPGPRTGAQSDILDPFVVDAERTSTRACAPELSSQGTPIQRPRSLEQRRSCTRATAPLRDPFEDADG